MLNPTSVLAAHRGGGGARGGRIERRDALHHALLESANDALVETGDTQPPGEGLLGRNHPSATSFLTDTTQTLQAQAAAAAQVLASSAAQRQSALANAFASPVVAALLRQHHEQQAALNALALAQSLGHSTTAAATQAVLARALPFALGQQHLSGGGRSDSCGSPPHAHPILEQARKTLLQEQMVQKQLAESLLSLSDAGGGTNTPQNLHQVAALLGRNSIATGNPVGSTAGAGVTAPPPPPAPSTNAAMTPSLAALLNGRPAHPATAPVTAASSSPPLPPLAAVAPAASSHPSGQVAKTLRALGENLRRRSDPYIDCAKLDVGPSLIFRRSFHARGGVSEPFPTKLHRMLVDLEKRGDEDIASFFSHGRAFAVHNVDRFVDEIMPTYFKQSKWSSFTRQLNLYGFLRITSGPDIGGFYHELFLKGRTDLSAYMRRVGVPQGADRRKFKGKANDTVDPDFYSMEPVVAAVENVGDSKKAAPHDDANIRAT